LKKKGPNKKLFLGRPACIPIYAPTDWEAAMVSEKVSPVSWATLTSVLLAFVSYLFTTLHTLRSEQLSRLNDRVNEQLKAPNTLRARNPASPTTSLFVSILCRLAPPSSATGGVANTGHVRAAPHLRGRVAELVRRHGQTVQLYERRRDQYCLRLPNGRSARSKRARGHCLPRMGTGGTPAPLILSCVFPCSRRMYFRICLPRPVFHF